MVKVFSSVNGDFDSFFDDDYIAGDGFYIKVKHDNHSGKFKIKEGKPSLEAKFEEKGKFGDVKVEGELKISSTGKHEFKGEYDLDKFVDNTEFEQKLEYNSATHEHTNTFELSNKGIVQDLSTKAEFSIENSGNWKFSQGFGYQHNPQFTTLLEYEYDGAKSALTAANIGLYHKSTDWMESLISYSTDGAFTGETDWTHYGELAWKSRCKTVAGTKLGFDYVYDLKDRAAKFLVGIETKPTAGVEAKSKLSADGEMEVSAKLEIADNWDLLMSTAMNASGLTNKQENIFGFGLEGKIK